MAKASKREYVWLECSECGDKNYRTEISVVQGAKKVELQKFCRRDRKRTLHKVKKK